MKHLGTIIDDNFWQPWHEGDKTYRMCMECGTPELVRDSNGFCIGRNHACAKDKNYWIEMALSKYNGFIFIPTRQS